MQLQTGPIGKRPSCEEGTELMGSRQCSTNGMLPSEGLALERLYRRQSGHVELERTRKVLGSERWAMRGVHAATNTWWECSCAAWNPTFVMWDACSV